MSKKKILTLPDPILREISEPVNKVDKEIKHLMDDMLETMIYLKMMKKKTQFLSLIQKF